MNKKSKDVFNELRIRIDEATAPGKLTKVEALDVLDELAGHLEMSIEALREELEAEDE